MSTDHFLQLPLQASGPELAGGSLARREDTLVEYPPELQDTIELTALFRRHPRFATMRANLETNGLRSAQGYLLTLDGFGDGEVGILLDVRGVAYAFEVTRGRAFTRRLPATVAAEDDLVAEIVRIVADESQLAALERAVAETDTSILYAGPS